MPKAKKLIETETTAHMSIEALGCRASGGRHALPSLVRALATARPSAKNAGAVDVTLACMNDCGYTVTAVFNIRSRERVSRKAEYPKDGSYLQPPGSGRMKAQDALEVLISRIWE
jgi:hypothetical protein